jgi:nucleoside-diphosphate-sugar epimerase
VVGDIGDRAVVDRLVAVRRRDRRRRAAHRRRDPPEAKVADFFHVNPSGTERTWSPRPCRAGVRRFVHVSSNSPFGTNPHPTDVFRQDEPYHPYYGYGRSKMEAELAVFAAVDRRARRRRGAAAVVLRPVPAAAPDHVLPMVRTRQVPDHRRRRAAPLDGVRRQPGRRHPLPPSSRRPHAARATGSPTPGRTRWPRSSTRSAAPCADEGFEVKAGGTKPAGDRRPRRRVADKLIQRTGRYQQQLHVLGEMDKTIACDISASRAELGYDPQVELYEGMRRSIRWCLDQGLEL